MKGRILLVDDERLLVVTLGRALSAFGFEVDTAVTGEDALASVERQEYDVIVTDLRMEGEDGFAVLRQARSRDPQVCVVVITGYSNEDAGLEALRQGADDYLFKPFQPEELVLRVARQAEKRELRRKVLRYERLLGVCSRCGRFRWVPGPEGGRWAALSEPAGPASVERLSPTPCPGCQGV
ncbi:response regulator [Deferrisoma camini]|uniref:response regulator n=1 Tax=Deferrisoma camini TaxID=1035120 RepID=UPI00046D5393|nr:response regulator [Deferrisoma camini]